MVQQRGLRIPLSLSSWKLIIDALQQIEQQKADQQSIVEHLKEYIIEELKQL